MGCGDVVPGLADVEERNEFRAGSFSDLWDRLHVVIGFAAFWGFVHHGACYRDKQDCFLQTWGSCSVSIMSSGAMAILSGVYMLTRNKVYTIAMAS